MKTEKIWTFVSALFDVADGVLAIVVAAALIVKYEISSRPTEDQMLAAILGILTFMAISGLWDRLKRLRRIQELAEKNQNLLEKNVIHRFRADEFFVRGSQDSGFYANAQTIAISGITLGNTISEYRQVLRQRVASGAYVRIIVVDPDSSDALQQIVLRSWGSTDVKYYRNRLNNTLALIKLFEEVRHASGRVEVGLLPFVPSFGIQMVDPRLPVGAAIVEIYHHGSDSQSPKFKLTANDDLSWLSFFAEQFELMWEKCTIKKIINNSGSGD